MIYCHSDPFQPRFPSIGNVAYVGGRPGQCGYVEKIDERFASSWYRQSFGSGNFAFEADGPGSSPWAVKVIAKREAKDPGDPYYTVSMDADMGFKTYFEMGS